MYMIHMFGDLMITWVHIYSRMTGHNIFRMIFQFSLGTCDAYLFGDAYLLYEDSQTPSSSILEGIPRRGHLKVIRGSLYKEEAFSYRGFLQGFIDEEVVFFFI